MTPRSTFTSVCSNNAGIKTCLLLQIPNWTEYLALWTIPKKQFTPSSIRKTNVHIPKPLHVPSRNSIPIQMGAFHSVVTIRLWNAGSDTSDVMQLAARPKPSTPLYDNLLRQLESATDRGRDFMEFLAKELFFDKLLRQDERGRALEKPVALSLKIEQLLRMVLNQRTIYVGANFPSPERLHRINNHQLEDDDVTEILDKWGRWPPEWMNPAGLEKYTVLLQTYTNAANRRLRGAFECFKHGISGCQWLLKQLLKFPLIPVSADSAIFTGDVQAGDPLVYRSSAEQPSLWKPLDVGDATAPPMRKFLDAWNVYKESEQYKDIKKHSTERLEIQQRVNEQIISALQRRVLWTPTVSLTKQSRASRYFQYYAFGYKEDKGRRQRKNAHAKT